MATHSAKDRKAARQTFNKGLQLVNQIVKEERKLIMQHKKEKALKRRNSMLATMVQIMRDKGAGEQTIQRASTGLDEFVKFASREGNASASQKPNEDAPAPNPNEEALGVFLSQVETQEVHWLWHKRIPLGKITLLDGDPGMGKSMLALNLAASVSSGRPMPDGTPSPQGGVILIAPEDGAADTLKPRLEAAGGDPSCVLLLNTVESLDAKKMQVVDRPFSLSQDLELLEQAIKQTNALLVVLDPLMAVLGHRIDSSRDQDIREVFTPLTQLAERTGCAILIIRHLNKGASENALYRGAGSIGIIAAARIGLLVAQDPHDEHKRILATTKNNLSQRATNLSYQIVENASGIPSLHWLGENHTPVSTLLKSGTNLSLERQQILQVLRDADGPLGPQDLADRTGQNYILVRQTLSRMHEAGEITRPSRGKYTTLDHPSLLQKSMHTETTVTTVTNDTSDTSDTIPVSAGSFTDVCGRVTNDINNITAPSDPLLPPSHQLHHPQPPFAPSSAEGSRKLRGPDFTLDQLIEQENHFQDGLQLMEAGQWQEVEQAFRTSIAMGDCLPQPWCNLCTGFSPFPQPLPVCGETYNLSVGSVSL